MKVLTYWRNSYWSINPQKRSDSPNQRITFLFSFHKIYIRDGKFKGNYCYELVLGKFRLLLAV